MKKVLFIAYYFPPDNTVGGLRIAKFARYLPAFGWEPTILTIEDRFREQVDNERLKDLGETKILKTILFPRFMDFLLTIKRKMSVMLGKKRSEKSAYGGDAYGENFEQIQSETFLNKLKRYFISLSFSPDSERRWIIPATIRAVIEIRRGRFKFILTSSPPHSSHLIGLILKKLLNVNWVADFRDPWIDILPNRTPLIRSALSDLIEKWLEKLVIRHADKIITTTDEHKKAVMSRFQAEPSEKFVSIPNSIDTEKFNTGKLQERYDKFTISYAGTIYLKRTPEPIFKAIRELISSCRIDPSQIRFKLFGYCELIDGKPISPMIKAYGLDSIVEVSKPIPFNDALITMQRSHLLLLLVSPVQAINIPAKLYDYLGSGTKIIAVTEPGAASAMISKTDSGACFSPTDIDGIAEFIFKLFRKKDRDHERNDPSLYAYYGTKILTRELAQLLLSLDQQFS